MQNEKCKMQLNFPDFAFCTEHFAFCPPAAGERPPHKETQTYGCCVSTLTRFVRPPLQRPLTGSRASKPLLKLYAQQQASSKVAQSVLLSFGKKFSAHTREINRSQGTCAFRVRP